MGAADCKLLRPAAPLGFRPFTALDGKRRPAKAGVFHMRGVYEILTPISDLLSSPKRVSGMLSTHRTIRAFDNMVCVSVVAVLLGACSATGSDRERTPAPIVSPMSDLRTAPTIEPAPEVSRSNAVADTGTVNSPPPAPVHIVAAGENLFRIALNNGLTTAQLAALNDLQEPYVVFPGQALRLGASMAARRPEDDAPQSRMSPVAQTGPLQSSASALRPPERGVDAPGAPSFSWPARGRVIARDRALATGGVVPGWTIVVEAGASIHAAADGEVLYAGNGVEGFGNLLLLSHGRNWVTAYGHNDRLLVERGARVNAGDRVAIAQNPRRGGGTEIYFEIRNGVTPIDPGRFLGAPVTANASLSR